MIEYFPEKEEKPKARRELILKTSQFSKFLNNLSVNDYETYVKFLSDTYKAKEWDWDKLITSKKKVKK